MSSSSAKAALQWLTDYKTALKHGSIKPFSLTERKARAATRNQPWGPTGTELSRLADLSHSPSHCAVIMRVVEIRLAYPPHKWRNVYKGLTLLEHLLRHGSEACVSQARRELLPRLEDLATNFVSVEGSGRDVGINVRHRAQAIATLMRDEPRLASERAAHAKKRGVYQGFSSFDVMAQGGPALQAGSGGGWAAAPQDGGHLSRNGSGGSGSPQPGSPDYRAREAGDGTRAAGETKGVGMEENQRYLAALDRLLQMPANRACADCGSGGGGGGGGGSGGRGGGGAPSSWASINCGVFLCMRCAGVHRGMGTHVSKVRSCTLDTWLPEQVEFMARTGNTLGNAYWQARMHPGERPAANATLSERESFVRRKYVERAFAAGSWPPPPERLASGPEIAAILADCLPPERTAQLAVPAGVSAAGASRATEAREAPMPAPKPAAAVDLNLIDLMDFEFEPESTSAPAAELAGPAAGSQRVTASPLQSLEAAFSSSSHAGTAPAAPSRAATDLSSWDMGFALAAQQQQQQQHPHAAPQAAQFAQAPLVPGAAAAQHPPRRAPYCPPWAPHPSATQPAIEGSAHMQLVPASAVYESALYRTGSSSGQVAQPAPALYGAGSSFGQVAQPAPALYMTGSSTGQVVQPAPGSHAAGSDAPGLQSHPIDLQLPPLQSNNPFAPTAASYYASLAPKQPQEQRAQQRLAPLARGDASLSKPPASPAEAKAQELISRDLMAFNLHAETVSALHPRVRQVQHGYPQARQASLAAMRSPGR